MPNQSTHDPRVSAVDADAIRLPLSFDPEALREDLKRIPDASWIPHFVTDNYEGDWSGVALRGPANVTHPIQQLFANPGTEAWANTSLYDQCSYFAGVMSSFRCNLLSVRLLRLAPGSIIREHVDYNLSLQDSEVRLHVPVQTNAAIEFWLNRKLIPLRAGETWYLNVNQPHRVENNSDEYRVHLVLDCEINPWLLELVGIGTNRFLPG